MVYPIPTLAAQSTSATYNPLKDIYLWLEASKQDIEDLEDNLTKLTSEVMSMMSRMDAIDQSLSQSVDKQNNVEYRMVKKNIEDVKTKYEKFISMYRKYRKDMPSVGAELNVENAEELMDGLQKQKPKFWTLKFFKLAKLSRDVAKLKVEASSVLERIKKDNLIVEKIPEFVEELNAKVDHSVYKEYANELLEYLKDKRYTQIGVTGPVGVGKTTVFENLEAQLKNLLFNDKPLDHVIKITLANELDTEGEIIEAIQDGVMEWLTFDAKKPSSQNARKSKVLKLLSGKTCILLIDQISTTIDLNKVGLPDNYGKVVFASRNRKVIHDTADVFVEIRSLSKVHAMEFFRSIHGEIDPHQEDIAAVIINSCGGLPLVIKLVAKYLKENKRMWGAVKGILQENTGDDERMLGLGPVGNAYRMVYSQLLEKEGNHIKKCLLYGALFPSENLIHKDYLTECWMAEGFIDVNDSQKLRATKDRGLAILEFLTEKYLYEKCSDKHVKMPLYCRKMALKQKYPGEEEDCLILASPQRNPLSKETWMKAKMISAISSNLKLPEDPKSKNLSTLLLQRNPQLVAIGDSFFKDMRTLRVLDLYEAQIKSLPESVRSLVNLVSLYLNNCSRLTMLQPVCHLRKLELLDIRGTSIPSLPKEIGDMVQLRCLRISFAEDQCSCKGGGRETRVTTIPKDVISHLKELEEFIIDGGRCSKCWINLADQVSTELATLEKLTTLTFHFPTIVSLNNFLIGRSKSNSLNSFNISTGFRQGKRPHDLSISGTEKELRFYTSEENEDTRTIKTMLEQGEDFKLVRQVLKQANTFELVGYPGVDSLSYSGLENTRSLNVLIVEGCDKLSSIVNANQIDRTEVSNSTVAPCTFQSLEKLYLLDLKSLRFIWLGSASPGTLSNLKVLTLCGCPELKYILNHVSAKALSSLKHLKVENCAKLVAIVSNVREREYRSDALHKLETLELKDLPELQSVCTGNSMEWKSLRKIAIERCRNLRNLSLTMNNAKKLETIKCTPIWWDASELQFSEEEKQYFLPRCDFVVEDEASSEGTDGDAISGHDISTGLLTSSITLVDACADKTGRWWRFYCFIFVFIGMLALCLWMVRGVRKRVPAG